jgi:hypothetical protein
MFETFIEQMETRTSIGSDLLGSLEASVLATGSVTQEVAGRSPQRQRRECGPLEGQGGGTELVAYRGRYSDLSK